MLTRTKAAVVAAATSLTVVLGGVAMAPAASAASAPGCDWEWQWPQTQRTTTTINLRSGSGTGYTSKGLLAKGVKFQEHCNKQSTWSYGKVLTGANAGKWGWVATRYITF